MAASWGAQLIGGSNGAGQNVGGVASGPLIDCPGGLCVMTAAGTFNGCTVAPELLGPDGVTMLPAGLATTLTAPGVGLVYLPPCQIQAVVTGGPPTGLFVSIARVVG
jgi:hypothetical protein